MRQISEPVSSDRPACIVPIELLSKKFRVVKAPWLGGVASRLVISATTTALGHLAWPVSAVLAVGQQVANPREPEWCYFCMAAIFLPSEGG